MLTVPAWETSFARWCKTVSLQNSVFHIFPFFSSGSPPPKKKHLLHWLALLFSRFHPIRSIMETGEATQCQERCTDCTPLPPNLLGRCCWPLFNFLQSVTSSLVPSLFCSLVTPRFGMFIKMKKAGHCYLNLCLPRTRSWLSASYRQHYPLRRRWTLKKSRALSCWPSFVRLSQ